MKLTIKERQWKFGNKRGFQIETLSGLFDFGTSYNRILTYRR